MHLCDEHSASTRSRRRQYSDKSVFEDAKRIVVRYVKCAAGRQRETAWARAVALEQMICAGPVFILTCRRRRYSEYEKASGHEGTRLCIKASWCGCSDKRRKSYRTCRWESSIDARISSSFEGSFLATHSWYKLARVPRAVICHPGITRRDDVESYCYRKHATDGNGRKLRWRGKQE